MLCKMEVAKLFDVEEQGLDLKSIRAKDISQVLDHLLCWYAGEKPEGKRGCLQTETA